MRLRGQVASQQNVQSMNVFQMISITKTIALMIEILIEIQLQIKRNLNKVNFKQLKDNLNI